MNKHKFEGKRVFWSNKWDKIWLLIIPVIFFIDIFTSDRYSSFWFLFILITASAFVIYVLYHMFNPRFVWIDTNTKKGKRIKEEAFELRYNDKGLFEYGDNGFHFTDKDEKYFVAWTDIEAIFAYKRDLMVVDELNMDIFLKENKKIWLTEEMDGWYQFVLKIKEVFPGIDKEFDVNLIFPPFETNLTLVYNATDKSQSELINQYYD